MLVWDIMRQPAATRLAERALNPLIGKSVIVYAIRQPDEAAVPPAPGAEQRGGPAGRGGSGIPGDAGKGDPEKTHAAA